MFNRPRTRPDTYTRGPFILRRDAANRWHIWRRWGVDERVGGPFTYEEANRVCDRLADMVDLWRQPRPMAEWPTQALWPVLLHVKKSEKGSDCRVEPPSP